MKPLILAGVAAAIAAVVVKRKRTGAKADTALWHEATKPAAPVKPSVSSAVPDTGEASD